MSELPLATIIEVLTNAPLSLLLLYLLVQERKEHAATRLELSKVNQQWVTKFETLAERVVMSVERLDLPGPP